MNKRDLALIADIRAELADGRARTARLAANVRLGEMASALGVTSAAVSQWESGTRSPSGVHALEYGRLLRQLAKRAA